MGKCRLYSGIFAIAALGFLMRPYLFQVAPPLSTGILPEELEIFVQNAPSLPRYVEASYSPLGRSATIDAILESPFYLPVFADAISSKIKEESSHNQLYPLSTICFRAGGLPIDAETEFSPATTEIPDRFAEVFEQSTGQKIYQIWLAFIETYRESEKILSVLTQEERQWIRENHEAFFFGFEKREGEYDFFTTDSQAPLKFFELASRLDLAKLTDCARKLAAIVDHIYQNRKEFGQIFLTGDFIWEQEGLKLIISAKRHTDYTESADFFLNIGDSNIYHNNAGGTEGFRPAALHVSLGGNNQYFGTQFVQGSGCLGVGICANFQGHNFYQAKSYSQGAGFFGSGLLMDLEGPNVYEIDFFGQSAALFGTALLWNKGGNSHYLSHEGMTQAATSTLGIAFLIDNAGNSHFISGVTGKSGKRAGGIGQGGSVGVRYDPWNGHPSFYGGVSFLYNGGGKNHYTIPWIGQGSAYFLSLGILVDEGNACRFKAEVDSQGQGLHLGAGLILQKGTGNHFEGGWGSLGVGGDRSVGMYIGTGGHHTYKGTVQNQGTARKPLGLGVFIDLQGNNFYSFEATSNANIQRPQWPNEWPSAFFMALGGGNNYPDHIDGMLRGENRIWGIPGHSVGIDQAANGGYPLKRLLEKFPQKPLANFPFNPLEGWATNTAFRPLKIASNHDELTLQMIEVMHSDYEKRRQLYERMDLYIFNHPQEQVDLSILLTDPATAPEDQFNYAALWAMQTENRNHLDQVIKALKNGLISSGYARKMGIKLIGKLAHNDEKIEVLPYVMKEDKLEENQAIAAFYLSQIPNPEILELLKPAFASPSEQVRYFAVKGLLETTQNRENVLVEISPLFTDPSLYVRRAAALTAISLKDKMAIPVLLGTLNIDTLDTTDNYGDNIFNDLASYVGVNYGTNKEAWIKWWEQAKNTFEFPTNTK